MADGVRGVVKSTRTSAWISLLVFGGDCNDYIDKHDLDDGKTAGPTYIGNSRTRRIDYTCLPLEQQRRVNVCRADVQMGRLLQMATMKKTCDHYPLLIIMDYLLDFVNTRGRREARLDRDIRSQEASEGANRHKFLEALAACGEGNWQELRGKATTPDALWRDLVQGLREAVASLCTPTLRKADHVYSKLAGTRMQLVKEIGSIRRRGGEVDSMKQRLGAIQKQLKKASRQWNFWTMEVALEELTETHRRNETAVACWICRRIAHTSTGKGKTYFAGIAEEQALWAKDMNDGVKARSAWNGMKKTIFMSGPPPSMQEIRVSKKLEGK